MTNDLGIPRLFVRDGTLTRQVTPGCEWVMEGLGTPTRLVGETHGEQLLPEIARDYDVLRAYLSMTPIDGIVWWHLGDRPGAPDQDPPKLAMVTREDFGL